MNAIQRAKASIQQLATIMRGTAQARATFEAKRLPAPRATTAYINGKGMVQVLDADTGRCLGFRRTAQEAAWLQQALENGTHQQSA